MAIVQAKLQECVNSGQMNSFDRISNLFAGNAASSATDAAADGAMDEDVAMNPIATKDSSKVPVRKSRSSKASGAGMYGDKTSKKVAEKNYRRSRTSAGSSDGGRGRSRGRSIEGRKLRSSSKKRSGKKLATI